MSRTVLYIFFIVASFLASCNSPVDSLPTQIEQIEEDPPDFITVEKAPEPVKKVQPEYPELAKILHIEGTVWVKLLVTRNGAVRKAIIMKSDAEIFNHPFFFSGMQWEFTPAIMNNKPIEVWAAVPFTFSLRHRLSGKRG
ncbi:MAG: TonB family protein [Ignavibacteriae bacterium]|nr:TonB family protein [Ignavibacteriota bacterium]